MTEKKGRPRTPIERPSEDLKKERDAFIQQFFRKGAQLTEELLKENERLRERISELEGDNQRLKAHLASDEAIRDLVRKIEKLEAEKRDLIHRSTRFEQATDEFGERFAEVESELANLANLYIATSQLHSAQSVRSVLRNLKELLAQLLGAANFGIYLASDDGKQLVAIAREGLAASDVAHLPIDTGPVAAAFKSGEIAYDHRGDTSKGTLAKPAAVIPLRVERKVIGATAIFSTLPQKTAFVNVDNELFKMLSAQAAPALINARLFTETGRKIPGIQAFLDLED